MEQNEDDESFPSVNGVFFRFLIKEYLMGEILGCGRYTGVKGKRGIVSPTLP